MAASTVSPPLFPGVEASSPPEVMAMTPWPLCVNCWNAVMRSEVVSKGVSEVDRMRAGCSVPLARLTITWPVPLKVVVESAVGGVAGDRQSPSSDLR